MAIFHFSVQIIGRQAGRSAVAASAYRSAEKLTNQYDGLTHDYTKKQWITHTEILLPEHSPPEFKDREALWNSVEAIEKPSTAQLAREITIALPRELSPEAQITLIKEFVKDVGNLFLDYAVFDKAYEWMMRIGDDNSDDFKELMGRALIGVGRYQEAEQLFNELLDRYPYSQAYE